MATFKDCEGKVWTIRITSGHYLRILDELKIDLKDAIKEDPKPFAEKVFGDVRTYGELLWILCEAQAEKDGMTPEQFAFRFDGETNEAAMAALWEALISFSQPRAGAKAGEWFRKGLNLRGDAINDALSKMTDSLTLESLSGNSAASSASTPAHSASAS